MTLSLLEISEAKLAVSATVVGGVELRDAAAEKVSAAGPRLDSEESARVGDMVTGESIVERRDNGAGSSAK